MFIWPDVGADLEDPSSTPGLANDDNIEMLSYMLSLPEIEDPEMVDGTTAFSMAIAKEDTKITKAT